MCVFVSIFINNIQSVSVKLYFHSSPRKVHIPLVIESVSFARK